MFNSWQSGKKYYLSLWGGALLITFLVITMGFWNKKTSNGMLKQVEFSTDQAAGELINELLLSSQNLQLEEKKDFINLYILLRSDSNYEGALVIENKRNAVYKNILSRKLNNLTKTKKPQADFSIKPVPR
jgi:hypothetical protein